MRRNFRRRKKHIKTWIIFLILVIFLVAIATSYALYSTQLIINGTATGEQEQFEVLYLNIDNSSTYPSSIGYMSTYSYTFAIPPTIEAVSMGGIDLVLNTDYTYTNGTLTIPDVTGALVIRGEGPATQVTVTFNNQGTKSTVPVEVGDAVSKPSPNPRKSGYEFAGWYDERDIKFDFTTPITQDITLHAVFGTEVYVNEEDYVFTGSNYIDTGIKLFDENNYNKDFEISFKIKERESSSGQATLMNCMDESGSPWPGIVYRIISGSEEEVVANVTGSIKIQPKYKRADVNKVTIKRINGVLYINLNDSGDTLLLDMTSLTKRFNVPVTFGASLTSSGSPQRYFTGTLTDMNVIVFDSSEKMIKFDPNTGEVTVLNQRVTDDNSIKLRKNTFTKEDYVFNCWNTKADGSGISYSDEQVVNDSIFGGNSSVTLYAQWEKFEYTVEFKANGGTGTMSSQSQTQYLTEQIILIHNLHYLMHKI